MLTHRGTKTIETERMILRRLTVEDAEAMYKNWASDRSVTKFLTWQPHTDVDANQGICDVACYRLLKWEYFAK